MFSAAFILDIIIAVLLMATVVYCWKLNKKIAALREGKEELNAFLNEFNNSIIRAEKNIVSLKKLGAISEVQLCEQIKKARFLANDLSFLTDKGENVADALEHHISSSKGTAKSTPAKPVKKHFNKPNKSLPQINARKTSASSTKTIPKGAELLLKHTTATRPANIQMEKNQQQKTTPTPSSMTPSKKQALDDVLSQISIRKKQADRPGKREKNVKTEV